MVEFKGRDNHNVVSFSSDHVDAHDRLSQIDTNAERVMIVNQSDLHDREGSYDLRLTIGVFSVAALLLISSMGFTFLFRLVSQ